MELGARSYDVVIGPGLMAEAGDAHRGSFCPAGTPSIVTDDERRGAPPPGLRASLKAPGSSAPKSSCRRARPRKASNACSRSSRRSWRRGGSATTSSWRSAAAWSATSPASPRRSHGAACASCRCRRRCWRRSIPASAARPASTRGMARTSSARSCSRRSCLPIPPRSTRFRSASSAPAMPRWQRPG